jgi:hypothetical protein
MISTMPASATPASGRGPGGSNADRRLSEEAIGPGGLSQFAGLMA